MDRTIQITVAAVLLLFVLAIVIAPSLDLPETVMRVRQMCFLILQTVATICLMASLFHPLFHFSSSTPAPPSSRLILTKTQLTC